MVLIAKLKSIAKNLRTELKVYQLVLKDPRTPKAAKILLAAAVGYFMFPFDIIPDFIPVLGQLDDAIIIPTLIYLAIKITPPYIVDDCRIIAARPIQENPRSKVL
jgi:uncharacterized membrane protein YkvA (DUF1232 family)